MSELLVDFITSLDGYASGEGWPGFWGLEGPEYLAWLGEQPEVTYLMGANTYRLMSGFAAGRGPEWPRRVQARRRGVRRRAHASVQGGVSSSLEEPLTWANSTLVRDDAVEAVRAMKSSGSGLLSTIGSLSLCRSLLRAGLVDRFRVVMFPVITGATGARTHLRRLSGRRPRDDRAPHLRRPHPAGRVQAPRARAPAARRPCVTSPVRRSGRPARSTDGGRPAWS